MEEETAAQFAKGKEEAIVRSFISQGADPPPLHLREGRQVEII